MKHLFKLLLLILFISFYSSCGNDSSTNTNSDNEYRMFALCQYTTKYYDFNNHNWIYDPAVKYTGEIITETTFDLDSFTMNGKQKNKYQYGMESQIIIKDTLNNNLFNNGNYDIFDLEMNIFSNSGEISGSISIPDIPGSFEVTPNDHIDIGEEVNISWLNDNADFYNLKCLYIKKYVYEDTIIYEYQSIDTILTDLSCNISGDFFNQYGTFYVFTIQSYNGPIPGIGASPNMTGNNDNYGYLYYASLPKSYDGEIITVGDSIPQSMNDNIELTLEINKFLEKEEKSASLIKKYLGL